MKLPRALARSFYVLHVMVLFIVVSFSFSLSLSLNKEPLQRSCQSTAAALHIAWNPCQPSPQHQHCSHQRCRKGGHHIGTHSSREPPRANVMCLRTRAPSVGTTPWHPPNRPTCGADSTTEDVRIRFLESKYFHVVCCVLRFQQCHLRLPSTRSHRRPLPSSHPVVHCGTKMHCVLPSNCQAPAPRMHSPPAVQLYLPSSAPSGPKVQWACAQCSSCVQVYLHPFKPWTAHRSKVKLPREISRQIEPAALTQGSFQPSCPPPELQSSIHSSFLLPSSNQELPMEEQCDMSHDFPVFLDFFFNSEQTDQFSNANLCADL